jgi:serine/threonine protein kinase
MRLSNEDLILLSRLLDEVLELDQQDWAAWLEHLDQRLPHIAPRVRALLARDSDGAHASFLLTLPKHLATLNGPAAAEGAAPRQAGDVVGPYRLQREIGQGGMSSVWSAIRVDAQIKRLVALKLPHVQLSHLRFAERFVRERDILAALTHPNIARLYDAGVSAEGQPYLAMEYVQGEPLTEFCDSHRLAIRARLGIFIQVLNAVQYAHANLVIHRDLKPSNILVTDGENVRLLDFGIAKLLTDGETKDTLLTQFGGRALTPEYASPEQILGQSLTTASDVYSLGVLLFELMTGTRPFRLERGTRAALEEAILNREPQRPSQIKIEPAAAGNRAITPNKLRRALSGDLDTIIVKSLRKHPGDRYATADAFRQDIERHLAGHTIEAKQESFWNRARKFLARNRIAAAGVAGVVLSLITGLAIALWQAGVAREHARIAKDEANTSRAMESFIENIFRANTQNQPDPIAARKTTARELLDVGVKQIDGALNDAPVAKLGVLLTLLNMYDDLGLSDEMLQLARKRVDIARTIYKNNEPELALALTIYANVAERIDLHAVAEPAYLEAEEILDRKRDYKSLARATLETNLGFFYYSTNLRKALLHAEKGVAAYRSFPPSAHISNALQGETYIYNSMGDYANGRRTGEEALAIARSVGAAGNDQLGQIYEGLGFAYAGLEDITAAETNFRRSYDIAAAGLGDAVFDQLEAAGPLGEFLVTTSRVAQGLEILQHAHDLSIALTGTRAASSRPARTLMRHGAALIAEGRLEDGMKSLELADALSTRQGVDPMIELNAQVSDVRAIGLIEMGDYAAAEQLLAKADALHRQSGWQLTPYNNRNVAGHTRLLLVTGRADEAEQALRGFWVGSALPVAARPRLELMVLQAELTLAQGNVPGALDLAMRARSIIAASPNRRYLKIWELRASLAAGKAKLAAALPQDAQTLLSTALDLGGEVLDTSQSPLLADAQIALAECWLDLGQRHRAAVLLTAAQSIHATHKALGEHYKKPLRRLRARMAGSQMS